LEINVFYWGIPKWILTKGEYCSHRSKLDIFY
jgi:hypothetical protein